MSTTDTAPADSAATTEAAPANAAAEYELNDSDFAEFEKTSENSKADDVPEDSSASEEEPEDVPAEEDSAEKPEESTETSEESEETPKAKNAAQNRIRDLANQNRDKDAEIARLKSQIDKDIQASMKPLTLDEAIAKVQDDPDFMDASPAEVRREARALVGDRAAEITAYSQKVQAFQADLNEQSFRVLQDFPMFDPNNKSRSKAQAALADAITKNYQQWAGFDFDESTKQTTGARVLPYDFYKSHADAYEAGRKAAQADRMNAAAKNAAAAEPPSRAAPKAPAKDKYDEAIDAALAKYA